MGWREERCVHLLISADRSRMNRRNPFFSKQVFLGMFYTGGGGAMLLTRMVNSRNGGNG